MALAAVAGRRFDFDLLQSLTGLSEPALIAAIKALIAAQLVVEESADQFAFRHVLTRQAVYAELLTRERQTLHRAIALTLERAHADSAQSDRYLGDLAYHFSEAAEWAKALAYSRRAGARAQAMYAPRAAIEHFTRALHAAGQLQAPALSDLYRGRGLSHEVVGEFELARADLETALTAARAAADRAAEWRGLMELGSLWASRDYGRTGGFLREALALARQLGESSALAHTLNRLGNWYVNVERPQEGLDYHKEALTIFQQLQDRPGLAETLDLAGMACYLGCDSLQGTLYFQQALALFQELSDWQGLSSCLATLTMRGATYQTNLTVCPVEAVSQFRGEQASALKLAQDIGWRSGEAYAQFMPSFCLGSKGDYGQALARASAGLRIAEEIEHRQWMTAAHCALGAIYLDLLAVEPALAHLQASLSMAREIGSLHWRRTAAGFLASVYLAQNNPGPVQALLGEALGPEPLPALTLGLRLVWFARAELALVDSDPDAALQILDQIEAAAQPGAAILRLAWLRGQACAAKRDYPGAQQALETALAVAAAQSALPMQWRVLGALSQVHQAQGRPEPAAAARGGAVSIIDSLAANIPDPSLANAFKQTALANLSAGDRRDTARHAAKLAAGGLTARERQVAGLIAQGRSNRDIAGKLVLSERTIEGHVGNILSKLNLTSRSQVAAWAVEKVLAASPPE